MMKWWSEVRFETRGGEFWDEARWEVWVIRVGKVTVRWDEMSWMEVCGGVRCEWCTWSEVQGENWVECPMLLQQPDCWFSDRQTYKGLMRPILEYNSSVWYHQIYTDFVMRWFCCGPKCPITVRNLSVKILYTTSLDVWFDRVAVLVIKVRKEKEEKKLYRKRKQSKVKMSIVYFSVLHLCTSKSGEN